MKRYFGCHVSASGGLELALSRGEALGVNTIQIHPSPPQRWNSKAFAPGVESKYLAAKASSCVEKVFFHAIYLINLANPDPQAQHLSRTSLLNDLDLAHRIGAEGVIFHVGSLKDEPDENAGYTRAAEAINWIFEHYTGNAKLILEVSAGSGKIVGDQCEELRTIFDQVKKNSQLGFGLDTQHMWASGYDIRGKCEEVISEIEKHFGADKVFSIHVNDSKTELASRKDRHENLGHGLIGSEAIAKFINHPTLANIPLILETPGLKEEATAQIEVDALRKLIEG